MIGLLLVAGAAAPIAGSPARAQGLPSLPEGVTPEMVRAIDQGLEYLRRTQSADGSWSASDRSGQYPVAMTSLALFALLAEGSTPSQGRYAQSIEKGVRYLLKCQRPNGFITTGGESRGNYGHGYAMLALAQAYGSEDDLELRTQIHRTLGKAVELAARSQSDKGGWNYMPEQRNDEGSVTITLVQGLRACRNAGIKVPKKTIDNAVGYIRNSQCADGGVAYRVGQGGSRPALAAAGLNVLYNSGIYQGEMVEKMLKYVKARVPATLTGGHAYYQALYAAQGLYLAGDEHWIPYFDKLRPELLRHQKGDGSWQGDHVGTTYGTAIACVILQLPYKNLPICNR